MHAYIYSAFVMELNSGQDVYAVYEPLIHAITVYWHFVM